MKLSPLGQMKVAAVLTAAFALLGCEAPSSSAVEQTPAVVPAAAVPGTPSLVTVTPAPAPAAGLPPAGPGPGPEPTPPGLSAEEPARAPVKLSDRLQEVVKLSQSGVGDDVILAFIQ